MRSYNGNSRSCTTRFMNSVDYKSCFWGHHDHHCAGAAGRAVAYLIGLVYRGTDHLPLAD
jgi:hypothetical protein